MTQYIGRNGIQRGGAIRREIIGIPPNKTEKKQRNYAGEKRVAKNVGIGLASVGAVAGLAVGAHSLYRRHQMRQLLNDALIVDPVDPLDRNMAQALGGLIEVPPYGDDVDLLDFRHGEPIELDSDEEDVLIEGLPANVPQRTTMVDLLPSALSDDESDIDAALISPAPPQSALLPQQALPGVVDVSQIPEPSRISGLARLARNLVLGAPPNDRQIKALLNRQINHGDAALAETLGQIQHAKLQAANEYLQELGNIAKLRVDGYEVQTIRKLVAAISSELMFRNNGE